nr:MAG TPA: hypothetical protein [Caudoviricetes sp.]
MKPNLLDIKSIYTVFLYSCWLVRVVIIKPVFFFTDV